MRAACWHGRPRDGRTIVLVLHDLNQACRYAHHLVAMRDGRVYAAENPREVVDAELVHAVLNLRAEILDDPVSGTPLCIPLSRAARVTPAAVRATSSS